ncbi:hypothetical protein Q361_1352 [Flavobacterium croceum DSM 17960]|uniref:Uncharacterized protein n=1 Tax=Flavobacterium croceum DSM 17960 TaxID=1121886 RepID=A0A2S4N5U0_9FLAO|nr:hypothetical protein [Flavobacterium croceum]POS00653.1 hypothetical protein Q361_1352 [Flavobacterium croceum DSM 17960]
MRDYGMLLEKTIEEYWGQPKTPIYFANLYGDKFEMRAILFSLVTYEVNYKPSEYTEEELRILKEYEQKCWNENQTHNDNISILEFLAKHRKLI